MIEFLKIILKKVNFKSDNEKLNKFNIIIYSCIIISAIILLGLVIWYVIKNFPEFWENFTYNLKDIKFTLNK